jgi:hypothetical protein
MWHSCRPSKKEYNLLGTKQLSIHNYNILSEGITVHTTEDLANTPDDSEPALQSTSNSEHKQLDLLNQQIHHSLVEPAHLPVIQPSQLRATLSLSYSSTISVFPTMTMHTQTNPSFTNTQTTISIAFQQWINDIFQTVLKRAPPLLGGGGGRGGDGGGGGEGAPPLAGPDPALQPVAQAADVHAMEKQPQDFYSDREKADNFIEEVKEYLCLNQDVSGFDSPKKKAAFILTCMKEPEVVEWV